MLGPHVVYFEKTHNKKIMKLKNEKWKIYDNKDAIVIIVYV